MSFPSRTAAIMPHPHEQKLQDVVNSLTLASFSSWAAALTGDRSKRLLSAKPGPPHVHPLSTGYRGCLIRTEIVAAGPALTFGIVLRTQFLPHATSEAGHLSVVSMRTREIYRDNKK